jgi:uncharacterized membrane protein YesL
MYKRLTELSFVIGLFFLLTSIILAVNGLITSAANNRITFFTAGGFFLFSIFMLLTRSKSDS